MAQFAAFVLFGPDGKPLGPAAFRPDGDFGPGLPRLPWQLEADARPREYDYTPGFNLSTTPRGEESQRVLRFATLRSWRTLPYVGTAIDYRKSQVRGTEWKVVPRDRSSKTAAKEFAKKISAVERFFVVPDSEDRLGHGEWISQVVEEVLKTDALTIFRHPKRNGELEALVQIDGSTIKVVIDGWGRVVGYQQILSGYPRTYYPAFSDASSEGSPVAGRLIYRPMNPRVDSAYGCPPIETMPDTATLVTKRWSSWLAQYTEGNVPAATMTCPAGWSVDEIKKGQAYFDALFSGNEKQFHKVRLIPDGSKIDRLAPFVFSKEESEELKRVVSAHFGVPPSIFVEPVNRATAETMQAQATDTGHRPLVLFLKGIFDEIIAQDFDGAELERIAVQAPAGTELERAQAASVYVEAKIKTVNEARSEIGLEPLLVPEQKGFDPNLIQRSFLEAGIVTVNELRATLGLGPIPGGDVAAKIGQQPPAVGEEQPAPPPPVPKPPAELQQDATSDDEDLAKAELAQWHRFAARRLAKGRHCDSFEAEHVPEFLAARIRHGLKACRTRADLAKVFDPPTTTENRFRKAFAA